MLSDEVKQRTLLGPAPKTDYSTPAKALNKCGEASRQWLDTLRRDHGYDGVVTVRCTGWLGDMNRAHGWYNGAAFSEEFGYKFVGHVVAMVGDPATGEGVYVDWTMRQFDSDAPYPTVLTADEILELWEDVDCLRETYNPEEAIP